MITTEYLPFPGIGFARAETSAEAAALTGSITGGAFGLFAKIYALSQ